MRKPERLFRESDALCRTLGEVRGSAYAQASLALPIWQSQPCAEASTDHVWGAVARLRDETGGPFLFRRPTAPAGVGLTLGDEAFDQAWREGTQ